jgi:hypothetical protein
MNSMTTGSSTSIQETIILCPNDSRSIM